MKLIYHEINKHEVFWPQKSGGTMVVKYKNS